jgi:hypothetical protein
MKPIIYTLALAGGLAAPLGVQAENISLNFYALGIRAGTITVNGNETNSSYSLRGAVTPTALLKKFKDVGFNGSASGSTKNGNYYSKKYAGNARTGSHNSVVQIRWSGKTPIVEKYAPKREKRSYDINPAKQTNTKDLLTAAYAVFKTVSVDKLCNKTHHMFDGRRRTQINLGTPKMSGKIATCNGTYKRIAGFSPSQMQKKVNFPFTMYYEHQNDGSYRFKEFTAAATFGKIRATRR